MFRAKFPFERQLDKMDCGPACLKIVAKFYGRYYNLQYLRELCGTTREGVSLAGLSYGAEKIGLRTLSAKCTIEELTNKIPLPAVVHLNSNHFVVVYRIRSKYLTGASKASANSTNIGNSNLKISVSDPAKGIIDYSLSDFAEKWIPGNGQTSKGVVLLMEPRLDFHTVNSDKVIEEKRSFSALFGYFSSYKSSIINLLIVMLLVTGMQAILPFISKAVIDVGIQTKDFNFINLVLAANIALIFCTTLSNAARDWILQHLTSRINITLISDYLIKLMGLPITFFETKMMGDILQRANDHERIRSFIMNNSLNLIFSALTFLVFGVILLIYNAVVFYFFLIGSVLYVVWVLAFLQIRKKLDWGYFELVSKNQSYWVETIECIADIKINNYEMQKRWKWESIQASLYKINLRILTVNNIQNLGAQFIDSVKNLLITFFCAKAVIMGDITFGVMISTQFIIGMLNGPVVQFIQFVASLQFAQISFQRLNEIHALANEDDDSGQNNMELPKNRDLVLDNVFFQYGGVAQPILRGLRLTIPEGKVTAIVGDSGSGKSTLLKLLLRLYKPSYGDILIGGMNINNISLRQWRENCGAVMQDGKLFNDSILNNIVLDDEQIDYDRLHKAVSAASISDEIERLPQGYQTKIGEQGRGLSGGQKQRILIARALYKNPAYLFFDEATNALDLANEQKIVKALDEVFKDKTVVVVAHRLSTIRKADQIVVMRGGFVTEIGNHEMLLARKGHYYKLVQMQTGEDVPEEDNSIIEISQLLENQK